MTTTSPGGPPPAAVLTRRGLLVVGAGTGLVVAGCSGAGDDGRARPGAAGPDPSAATRGGTGAEAADDDADLVGLAREALAATAALVAASRRSAPSLRADLDPLLRLHEAHAEALGRPLERVRSVGRAAPAGPLLGLVRDREEQLRAQLVDLSVRADSGSLARLLASMSAGLAQRLAVLPTAAPVRPGGGA